MTEESKSPQGSISTSVAAGAELTALQQTKSIFVAYAYNIYKKKEYRGIYTALEKIYGVKFIFADEKITNMHILQKIISYIAGTDFSLFDISGWNPNVTLELGIAYNTNKWYICFNPKKTRRADVPSDIKGIDQIRYSSLTELSEKLTVLLEQHYPKGGARQSTKEFMLSLQSRVLVLLREQPGIKMNEIAKILQVNVKFAQVIVNPLIIENKVRVVGVRRGARYYIK